VVYMNVSGTYLYCRGAPTKNASKSASRRRFGCVPCNPDLRQADRTRRGSTLLVLDVRLVGVVLLLSGPALGGGPAGLAALAPDLGVERRPVLLRDAAAALAPDLGVELQAALLLDLLAPLPARLRQGHGPLSLVSGLLGHDSTSGLGVSVSTARLCATRALPPLRPISRMCSRPRFSKTALPPMRPSCA